MTCLFPISLIPFIYYGTNVNTIGYYIGYYIGNCPNCEEEIETCGICASRSRVYDHMMIVIDGDGDEDVDMD